MNTSNRNSILSEHCKILAHEKFAQQQYILRLHAPGIAKRARAGSFVHIKCDNSLAMRRPLSIMHADSNNNTISLLYKAVGLGTEFLSQRKIGESLDLLGPIGKPFELHSDKPRALLIGGGVGIPPMVFIADTIRKQMQDFSAVAILGSEIPFPFSLVNSTMPVSGITSTISATMPLLENWGIAARLCSLQNYPACFNGYVTELARHYLESLSDSQRSEVEIFSCGPTAMLAAVTQLAKQFNIACQVSLEEYMACAVGGCAGCVVKINDGQTNTMKRVCVDGPVFDAYQVDLFNSI